VRLFVRIPQAPQAVLLRLWDQKQGPPQRRQLRGARGRQLAHGHNGQRPQRQKRAPPLAVRTTTRARHSGQSRRQQTWGRAAAFLSGSLLRAWPFASRIAWWNSGSLRCQRQTVATWTPAASAA